MLCSKVMTFHQSCEFNTFRNNPGQIPDRWCIIHASLSYQLLTHGLHHCWKRAHSLAKSAICLQGNCYLNTFKGAHLYAYFLKLYIILYFRASFQLFSNILTSFRWGDFIPARKGIAEIVTQIRQRFCKRRSKSFIEKLSDFTFAADFGHEKNSLFGTFYFRNQLIWARQ